MKPKELPQAVLAKWLDFADRCEALEVTAREAEVEVDRLRHVMASKSNDISAEEFGWARDNFQRIYTSMQTKRACANTQAKLLSVVKVWIDRLPDNTSLIMVQMPVNGIDLARVRAELKEARQQLKVLQGNPPPSSDIGRRIDDLIAGWARSVRPEVRGYAAGQTLAMRWPADSYGAEGGNAVGLLAALFPSELKELVLQSIVRQQPLSQAEHASSVAGLEAKIDELGYVMAALVERNGGEFDIELQPQHVLGVRLEEAERAVA